MAYYDREPIGSQPFKRQIWLHGEDRAWLLYSIVGWAVGCHNDKAAARAVHALVEKGLVTTRLHKCAVGEWPAYALTAAGFDELARIGDGDMHDDAVRRHQFYAARGSL